MNRYLLVGGVVGVLVLQLGDLSQAQFDNPVKYGWTGSLAQGMQQARQSGKPMMVVFRCQP